LSAATLVHFLSSAVRADVQSGGSLKQSRRATRGCNDPVKDAQFIFIKGLKVGETSVEIALSTICGADDIVTPITAIDELTRLSTSGGARNYPKSQAAECLYLQALLAANLPDLPTIRPPQQVYYNHMSLLEVIQLQGSSLAHYRQFWIERDPYAKILSWANHELSYAQYEIGGDMRADPAALKAFLGASIDDRRIAAVRNIERYRGPAAE
jgi:hypothetical protein